MKIVDELLEQLYNSDDLVAATKSATSLTIGINTINSFEFVSKLKFLGKNSASALDAILSLVGFILDVYGELDDFNDFDVKVAALLVIVIDIDPIVARFLSMNILRASGGRLWWAEAIARNFLLKQELVA
jgi:hypothetical protein